MKRFALMILLLVLAACESTTAPTISNQAATLARTAQIPAVDIACNDRCFNGTMHWTVDFNAFGVASLERAQIRVYALDPSGARRFLGNATDTGTAPTSSRFQYEVESVAPRYALTDRDGYGYEPWQGWTRLEFDIYAQHGHALLATIGAWSDIPMIDNYPGHFCAE